MKFHGVRNCLFVLLLQGVNIGFGQEWAEIGTSWYYDFNNPDSGIPPSGSNEFFVSDDTVIGGKLCSTIECQYAFAYNNWNCNFVDTIYTFVENDTVFFYDTSFTEFQILYDFNSIPGQYWDIRLKDSNPAPGDIDTVRITVDSVDVMTVNSIDLKRMYVTYQLLKEDAYLPYNGVIVESLGDLLAMFNFHCTDDSSTPLEGPYSGGLLCYDDPILGHYEIPGIDGNCTYVNQLEEISLDNLLIVPNPVTDLFQVGDRYEAYKIFNLNGGLMLEEKLDSHSLIDISNLISGIYIFEARTSHFEFQRALIIKY